MLCLSFPFLSYDYDWKSNRWASGTVTHVVDIIALSDDNNETGIPHTITILTCATSPSFFIASTKKSTITATNRPGMSMVGEKRKQQSVGINVGPSPSRQPTFKHIQHMSQFPIATMVGGAIGGGGVRVIGRSVYFIQYE